MLAFTFSLYILNRIFPTIRGFHYQFNFGILSTKKDISKCSSTCLAVFDFSAKLSADFLNSFPRIFQASIALRFNH